MSDQHSSATPQGAQYATVFHQKLLGANCDIDVVVDLVSLEAEATIAMKQMFSAQPSFTMTAVQLRQLEAGLREMKRSSALLDNRLPEAADHQLNISAGAATAIILRPEGKPARFALSVGLFHREGALAQLPLEEIGQALRQIDALLAAAVAKVRNGRGK